MSLETITEEYKLRNNIFNLSDYDTKLIKSIQKLRERYSSELSKRKCTIYLKEQIVVSVFDKKTKEKESNKIETKNKLSANICEAIQMNGKKCTAKSKLGENFCGRHCKK